jgi:hypothetical protein
MKKRYTKIYKDIQKYTKIHEKKIYKDTLKKDIHRYTKERKTYKDTLKKDIQRYMKERQTQIH